MGASALSEWKVLHDAMESPGALSEWKGFLSIHARGGFDPDSIPLQPDRSLPIDPEPAAILYTSPLIDDDTARRIRSYCAVKDHLPPPRSPYEALRGELLLEYDILGPVQKGNIQGAVEILSAFFPTALCTFTLFNNDIQTFYAIAGSSNLADRYNLKPNDVVLPDTSLCGHCILFDDVMSIPRMDEDWRFRSNPYVKAGIISYIGSPVSLQCDPLEPGRTLGIGALNIMFVDDPHSTLSSTERLVVVNVTKMLVAQLRATWEGHVRTKEAKARKAVTDLLQEGYELGFGELAISALSKLKGLTGKNFALIDVRGCLRVPPATCTTDLSIPTSAILSLINNSAQLDLPAPHHFILRFGTEPIFIILGIADIPISDSTISLAKSLGSILLANIIQVRISEADAAKTAFLSSISHELRTPLYCLMSGLELAQQSSNSEALDTAKASGLALQNILNDVLDFGRTTGVTMTTIQLEGVAKSALGMCLTQYKTKSKVILQCEKRQVEVDEAKYHRILINGITNALKFCPSGTISISIAYKDRLVTRVIDSGIGFDQNILPRLLEPFTKQDSHTPGAGLGLHTTKQLAESLGGTLDLRCEGMTTFEVVLPVEAGESGGEYHEVYHEISESILDIAPAPVDALRVLIVDDNAICLKLLRASLKRSKIPLDCAQAENGQQAAEVYKTFRPHLVFTDVSMPVMDGVEAAREMRRTGWASKIYALTGLGSSDPRLKSAGIVGGAVDGWLVKGLDGMDKVHSLVEQAEKDRLGKVVPD